MSSQKLGSRALSSEVTKLMSCTGLCRHSSPQRQRKVSMTFGGKGVAQRAVLQFTALFHRVARDLANICRCAFSADIQPHDCRPDTDDTSRAASVTLAAINSPRCD